MKNLWNKCYSGLSGILFVLLVLVIGCATPDVQPINIKDQIGVQKSEVGGQRLLANVFIDHRGPDGKLKDHREYHNLVVNTGKAGVASRINGADSEAAFTYIAIGTGTTAAAAGDTTLEAEITTDGGARAAATCSRVTVTVTNDTAQLVLTYNFTASFAVTESGVLNAGSSGTMLARRVFSAVNVGNGDSLQVTWKFTAS
jgi:hypothetical protein